MKYSFLNRFRDGRIAVLGDMMLDVYLWGRVTRISPEAPVPVVNVLRRTSCPGGAANVLFNLAGLGSGAFAFGVTGDDAQGEELAAGLRRAGVDVSGLAADASRCTTEKRRVLAGGQQLCRVDVEDTRPVDDALRRGMVNRVADLIRSGALNAVIFEDYRKGVLAEWMLEEIVSVASECGVVTALDPKPGSLSPVRRLSVIKPNRGEAFALAGVEDRTGGSAAPLEQPT